MRMSMKKIAALALVLAVLFSVARAENSAPSFADLSDLAWTFSSGAGGWSTDMTIDADGAFSGTYHDSEMGDTGDGYPKGTLYICAFSGRMTWAGQADECAWIIRVDELTTESEPGVVTINDGVRYITAEPYGLSEGDEMLLYSPGTPAERLSEQMRVWARLFGEDAPAELETWFLGSEKNESGFVGESWDGVGLANPWEEMTAERLSEVSGLSFGAPEGAEDVAYSYLGAENLAQMTFTLEGAALCARIQPTAAEAGGIPDISGM